MNELLMTDVREKFAKARELCPGMSEELYALTDYFATVANENLAPTGIMVTLIGIMDDLEKKRCGFPLHQAEFPEYLSIHSKQVRAESPYILQVIDVITDDAEFAEAVRAQCQEVFHWNVPKRVGVSDQISEHAYINAAVDWWAEQIQHPKMDNGTDAMATLMAMIGGMGHQRTDSEIQTFRQTLADGIKRQFEQGSSVVTLSVDYAPNYVLGEAGDAIGLSQFDFPCKTTMYVSAVDVKVSAGYGAPYQTIWSTDAS